MKSTASTSKTKNIHFYYKPNYRNKLNVLLKILRKVGMTDIYVGRHVDVIVGTIEESKLDKLSKIEGVDHIE